MATATIDKASCVICGKGKAALKCTGCSQHFCYNHVADHRQELNHQLDEVEVNRDVFRQTLTDQTADSTRHPLIKQIDVWERASIQKIRRTAEEARQLVLQHTVGHRAELETRLDKLTNELRQGRQDNDFFETELQQWKEELKRLSEELDKPSNMKLQQDSKALVNGIYVDVMRIRETSRSIHIGSSTRWLQEAVTVAGGNGNGNNLNQLFDPYSICVDNEQTIYVADTANNRIVEWKSNATSGRIVAGGNGKGNRLDQLYDPTDVIVDNQNEYFIIADYENRRVLRWSRRNGATGAIIIADTTCSRLAMDNNGHLYVSNRNNGEVRRWKAGDTHGTLVAGGNGKGDRLNQLNAPIHFFVDHEYSVYVSDLGNHRVVKWLKDAKEGIVVAGGRGQGSDLAQLSNPRGVSVDQEGNVYVVDEKNHRVMRWSRGATQGTVIVGGNGEGGKANQLNSPTGLSFDRQGNLYVADWGNDRVQRFNVDPSSSF